MFNDKPYPEPLIVADYNFGTIEYPRGWEFTLYEVSLFCSKFISRHGLFHFLSPETLVWYLHDCTDNDTTTMFLPECLTGMKEKGSKYIWCILSKQDLLPLEGREQIVAEHRARIETILKQRADPEGIKWFIVADPGWNLKEGKFVRPFVKGVTQKIVEMDKVENFKYQKSPDAVAATPSDEELRTKAEKAEIKDADVFWDEFQTANLTSWNHLDHLQAGYLVMLQAIEQKQGTLKCASTFLEHLARLRKTRPDIFRNSAHFTMTAFWLIQLRIAAFKFQYEANDGSVPTTNDFRSVVVHTPSLMSTRLWALYYTKEALFAPEARTTFVMPDLQPFPQVTKLLLKSLAEGKDDVTADEDISEAHGPADTAFSGPDRLPRWAFGVIQDVLRNNLRRGAAVKDALVDLQTDTLRLRVKYPKLAETGDVPPYSETQAYFWVQFFHALLSSIKVKQGKHHAGTSSDLDVQSLSFEQFQQLHPTDSSAWTLYYSQALWESVEARLEFVNPDKKPLPDVVQLL